MRALGGRFLEWQQSATYLENKFVKSYVQNNQKFKGSYLFRLGKLDIMIVITICFLTVNLSNKVERINRIQHDQLMILEKFLLIYLDL